MNCSDALTAMLEADDGVLGGHGGSELSLHISGCPRCSKVAAQLVIDTRQLGAALRTAPVLHRPRIVPWLVLAGGAVAVAVVLLRSSPNEAATGTTTGDARRQVATTGDDRRQEATTSNDQQQMATTGDDRRPMATSTTATTEAAVTAVAIAPVAYTPVAEPAPVPMELPEPVRPEPVAYALQPGDTVSSPASDGTVRVDPPEGVEARVLATRNPRITVVWLN